MHVNLITVLAFIFMVNFGEGSWTGFDTFLSAIGLVVAIKCFSAIRELDWFSVVLSASILSISCTNLLYFGAQFVSPLGDVLNALWGENEFWLFATLTTVASFAGLLVARPGTKKAGEQVHG